MRDTTLPASCTSLRINLIGLASLIVALLWLRATDSLSPLQTSLVALCAYAVPIMVLELLFLKTWQRKSTGLAFTQPAAWNLPRVAIRLLGYYATLGCVACFYLLFPAYSFSPDALYAPYWQLLQQVWPWLILLAVPYFLLLDRYLREPRDACWQVGMLLTGRSGGVRVQVVIQHFLGWLVKAFFLALMYSYLAGDVTYFTRVSFEVAFRDFQSSYDFLWRSLFMLDVILSAAGYILTLRILDAHMRSVEPTVIGWLAALVCYAPFWAIVYRELLNYDADGFTWGVWLADHPQLYAAWGSVILLLVVIYVLSTVAFGLRFSNLTHRGIITNGPYRYCKHPAYVSKNISWWLISIPFIPAGSNIEGMLHCMMLLAINLIYFIRARTEERHLSRDPVYVQYALAMNQRSVFRWLTVAFPFLEYRPVAARDSLAMPRVDYG